MPKFVNERIKLKHLAHKGAAILIILAGTMLIAQVV